MIHLTTALMNDCSTVCGLAPGEGMTQLLWGAKVRNAVTCPDCLRIYRSAQPAIDALCHVPEQGDI